MQVTEYWAGLHLLYTSFLVLVFFACVVHSHSVGSDSLWSQRLGYQTPLSIEFSRQKLEWVAISSSRGSSWLRDRTPVSCIAGGFFTIWATRKAPQLVLGPGNTFMGFRDLHRFSWTFIKGKLHHMYEERFFVNLKMSFPCCMWDLVPWPGMEPRPPVLGAQSLSHWTTRKSLTISF